jgi:hypothetical protein
MTWAARLLWERAMKKYLRNPMSVATTGWAFGREFLPGIHDVTDAERRVLDVYNAAAPLRDAMEAAENATAVELPPVADTRNLTRADKLAAVNEWDAKPKDNRPQLSVWLEHKYGTNTDGGPRVQEQTFHGWRRFRKTHT